VAARWTRILDITAGGARIRGIGVSSQKGNLIPTRNQCSPPKSRANLRRNYLFEVVPIQVQPRAARRFPRSPEARAVCGEGTRSTFVSISPISTRSEGVAGRLPLTRRELGQMRTLTPPPNFRTTDTWHAVGQRAVMRTPTGGRFTYQYDGAWRITRFVNSEGDHTTFTYAVASRMTARWPT
jgi:YD repeat-containing protein